MKKIAFIAFLVAFVVTSNAQSDHIKINSEGLKELNYLKMDEFFPTHYLYIDLCLREGLFPDANPEDMAMILEAVNKYVGVKSPLNIEIKRKDGALYKISAVIFDTKDGEILAFYTNWNLKTRKFDAEFGKESYTRWYFLNGDKMTYRKDMSNNIEYDELSKADLASAFLFDELVENDTKVKPLLDEVLSEEQAEVKENIYTHMTLMKYYILKRDMDNINKEKAYLEAELEKHADLDLRGPNAAYDTILFQLELMFKDSL